MKIFKRIILLSVINSALAMAGQNSDMIWEEPSRLISKSISGPMAMAIGLVAIVVCGLMWAISDGAGMGKGIRVVIALAIAGGAATLLNVFGFTSGMIF